MTNIGLIEIEAQDLKQGERFRKIGKRKLLVASKIFDFKEGDSESLRGKRLVCLPDCRQVVLDLKERINVLLICVLIVLLQTSCATIFLGGQDHCKVKPGPGQPQRQIHVGALIFDIAAGILPVAVDFATGNIYKPCNQLKSASK